MSESEGWETLEAVASNGWRCRLERWESYYCGWQVAITVYDQDGREVMHSGHSSAPFSYEEALKQAEEAPTLLDALKKAAKNPKEVNERW